MFDLVLQPRSQRIFFDYKRRGTMLRSPYMGAN